METEDGHFCILCIKKNDIVLTGFIRLTQSVTIALKLISYIEEEHKRVEDKCSSASG